MLGIAKDSYTDLSTNVTTESIYLRLYLSAFKSGLVAELKPARFTVLLAICSYMNEAGECYPTQEQIAERAGVSKATANKAVNDLLAYEFNGKPLISREIVQKGYFKSSVYKVNPITQVAIFGGEVESIVKAEEPAKDVAPAAATFKTAKDVGEYFLEVYRDVYGVTPTINYQRDYSQVKKKWIGQFSDKHIKEMIDTGVREYDSRWKNQKFPRPTLSALVSWIGEQAHGLAIDKEKEFEEVSEITSGYVEDNNNALSRLSNRLTK